ncbi:MAG: TPM domain-containing protein [Smithellaceae bacterium]
MKHSLTDEERKELDQRTAAAEKRTGVQIVLAIIERSDSYAELPWKAFALGASIAGLLIFIMNFLWPLNSPVMAALLAVVMILAAGAGLALLTVFIPDFARLFLPAHRAEAETKQYAESLFLNKQLFATRERKAVLLLVSLFERRIVVLPDVGLIQKINQQATENIIQHMRIYLKAGQTARALETGLKKLEDIIRPSEPSHELPNVIEEKGA